MHGIYSAAGLISGLSSSFVIGQIDEVYWALMGVMVGAFIVVMCVTGLLSANAVRRENLSPLAVPNRNTLGMGTLCFLALLFEGAVIDWAGIHLRESLGARAE